MAMVLAAMSDISASSVVMPRMPALQHLLILDAVLPIEPAGEVDLLLGDGDAVLAALLRRLALGLQGGDVLAVLLVAATIGFRLVPIILLFFGSRLLGAQVLQHQGVAPVHQLELTVDVGAGFGRDAGTGNGPFVDQKVAEEMQGTSTREISEGRRV